MAAHIADIQTLLSPAVAILHTRGRLHFTKRIVEHQGETYILHRFRRKPMFDRFRQVLSDLTAAGASIQPLRAYTGSQSESKQFGYWVALGYVPGKALSPQPGADAIQSFAVNLAKMHSLEGPANRALFTARHPRLPHQAYISDNPDLSTGEKQWISESHARLKTVPATQLTHGDLYSGNIIERGDHSVSLIDYELMVYQPAGMELAIALLRPFCRVLANRRLLLQAYMAHCSPQIRQAWQVHGPDFIFAAAARLVLLRKERIRSLRVQNIILRLRRALTLGINARHKLKKRLDKNLNTIRLAEKRQLYYAHVARAAIEFCRASTEPDALKLLQQANAAYPRPA